MDAAASGLEVAVRRNHAGPRDEGSPTCRIRASDDRGARAAAPPRARVDLRPGRPRVRAGAVVPAGRELQAARGPGDRGLWERAGPSGGEALRDPRDPPG